MLTSSSSSSKFAVSRNLSNNHNNNSSGNMYMEQVFTSTGDNTRLNSRISTSNSNNNNNNTININNTIQLKRIQTSNNIQQPYQASSIDNINITAIMNDIDTKVFNLKEIFRNVDPILERKNAATLIGALIRGYLCRQRLLKFRKGKKEWCWIRCRPITYIIDILLSIQSKRDSGFQLIKTNRIIKTLTIFYQKWFFIYKQNLPLRKSVKFAANQKIESKRITLLRLVFNNLKAVSVGDLSTRYANNVRRKLIETIRLELSEKYKLKTHNKHLGKTSFFYFYFFLCFVCILILLLLVLLLQLLILYTTVQYFYYCNSTTITNTVLLLLPLH